MREERAGVVALLVFAVICALGLLSQEAPRDPFHLPPDSLPVGRWGEAVP